MHSVEIISSGIGVLTILFFALRFGLFIYDEFTFRRKMKNLLNDKDRFSALPEYKQLELKSRFN